MPRQLPVKFTKEPSFIINRTAFRDNKLVYIARANKKLRYRWARSRIAYIGTTKKGARRIASSAARKGEDLLYQHGIKHLELHVVICGKVQGVETWKKLERALLIRFRERFGQAPRANKTGKKTHWRNEKKYFTEAKLDKVIDGLS
ncbi:MAG TPA: hypothetical protein VMW52_03940 [Phycisphaerae bacterium]|nr:hypothetical protein [Phycisphaerae bacterium]